MVRLYEKSRATLLADCYCKCCCCCWIFLSVSFLVAVAARRQLVGDEYTPKNSQSLGQKSRSTRPTSKSSAHQLPRCVTRITTTNKGKRTPGREHTAKRPGIGRWNDEGIPEVALLLRYFHLPMMFRTDQRRTFPKFALEFVGS